MRRAPIRIRTFILGTVLVLLLVPTLAGGAAWLIERDHQQAGIQQRLNTAVAYLTSHRAEMQKPAAVQGFASLLNRLDLLAQLVVITSTPPGKRRALPQPGPQAQRVLQKQTGPPGRGRPARHGNRATHRPGRARPGPMTGG